MKNLSIKSIGMLVLGLVLVVTIISTGASAFVLTNALDLKKSWVSFETGPSRKAAYLNDVYDAIGFGGVIHRYLQFVVLQDRKDVIAFHGNLRKAVIGLDRYFGVGVNDREKAALQQIADVLEKLSDTISAAEQLSIKGAKAADIGNAATIDVTPAIEGIHVLKDEIAKAEAESATEVNGAADAVINVVYLVIGVVGVLSLLILAVLYWFISIRLSPALLGISKSMTGLSAGNLDTEIPYVERRDEIGEMASAVQVFKENMAETAKMAERERAALSVREERTKKMDALTGSFGSEISEIVESISGAVHTLLGTAESMSQTSESTAAKSDEVALAAGNASANVQTVATAAEQLSASVTEISQQVGQSATIASAASRQASETSAQIQGLAEAAQKIGEVVNLISDIAEQTNLLALNATIEAARAGEAGKGFAVVASEVKNLATQTARATEEIANHVAGIQDETQRAVQSNEMITRTISEINEIAAAIASAVEQQGAATQEIARNVQEAARGTDSVTMNIDDVREAAGQARAASASVLDAANRQNQQAENLRSSVERFLDGIRAA